MHKRIKKLVENLSFEYRLALAPCLLKSAQPPEGIEGNSLTEFAHHDAVQMIICTSHHTTWMVKTVIFYFCGQTIEALSILSNGSSLGGVKSLVSRYMESYSFWGI